MADQWCDVQALVPDIRLLHQGIRCSARYETITRQRLIVAVDASFDGWVTLDYESNGETVLRVLAAEQCDNTEGRDFWTTIDEGAGTVVVSDHQARCGGGLTYWLDRASLECEDPQILAAALAGLSEMLTDPEIVPAVALCVVQLCDLIANTLTGTRWVRFIDGEDDCENVSLIGALREDDDLEYLPEGPAEMMQVLLAAYRAGRYEPDYTEPDVKFVRTLDDAPALVATQKAS
ncbi:hypothetical protein [Mycobacteroides abscessus]|uniref:hypothetical protein n=1 Tax=Mycobacteroides abscessus TaxID=36809 RepID=UPI0009A7458E|nr:hypothetical protein [Mycobacteroides abscessus]SLH41609.1 Uncharacterised protein [Mycobacteroides abscessus subsp. massiliense]